MNRALEVLALNENAGYAERIEGGQQDFYEPMADLGCLCYLICIGRIPHWKSVVICCSIDVAPKNGVSFVYVWLPQRAEYRGAFMMATKRMFTLVELCIVIGIISILVSIAIPNVIDARRVANEGATISNLRTITSAQALFREGDQDSNGVCDYAETLNSLFVNGKMVDANLGVPGLTATPSEVSGFIYVLEGTRFAYTVSASPRLNEGLRDFFVDESGIIRFDADAGEATFEAGPGSPPIGAGS